MSSSTCTCRFFGRAPSADRSAVSRTRSSSCCLTLCTPIRPTPPSRLLLLICPHTSSSRIIHWRRRRPSPPPTTTPAQRAAVRVSVLLLEFIGNENESLFAPPLSSVCLFVNGADTHRHSHTIRVFHLLVFTLLYPDTYEIDGNTKCTNRYVRVTCILIYTNSVITVMNVLYSSD